MVKTPTGTSFGAPSAYENVLAKMVIEAVPSVEMVRFTNSGRYTLLHLPTPYATTTLIYYYYYYY